jgi:hypothetical protein
VFGNSDLFHLELPLPFRQALGTSKKQVPILAPSGPASVKRGAPFPNSAGSGKTCLLRADIGLNSREMNPKTKAVPSAGKPLV